MSLHLPAAFLLFANLLFPTFLLAQAQEEKPAKYERNRITLEEIIRDANDYQTAYDIVLRLRPHFLHGRGSGPGKTWERDRQNAGKQGGSVVKVIIEGGRRGDVSLLNDVDARTVMEISYLQGSDATTRYGTGYEAGVIIVQAGRRI